MKRLGAKKGAAELKAHPFFANINWDDALQRKLPVPKITMKRIVK